MKAKRPYTLSRPTLFDSKLSFDVTGNDKTADVTINSYKFLERSELSSRTNTKHYFLGLLFNFGPTLHAGLKKPIATNHFNLVYVPRHVIGPSQSILTFTLEFQQSYIQKLGCYGLDKYLKKIREQIASQMSKDHQPITREILNEINSFHSYLGNFNKKEKKVVELMGVKVSALVILSLSQMNGWSTNRSASNYDISRIVTAKEYMVQHIGDPMTIADLVVVAGMNKDMLEKGFRDVFGTTVHNFLTLERIRHAKMLLEDTTLLIKQIARLVGYPNEPSFIRTFKRIAGELPSDYRKNQYQRSRNGERNYLSNAL